MKQWYMMYVGIDNGDAESGPILVTCQECIKATSQEKAEARAEKIYLRDYAPAEGYTVHLADKEELKLIKEQMRFLAIEDILPFI
jgi:hypothetical protein